MKTEPLYSCVIMLYDVHTHALVSAASSHHIVPLFVSSEVEILCSVVKKRLRVMQRMELAVVLLVAVVIETGYSQDGCSSPSTGNLESVIATIIQAGDSAAPPQINLLNSNIVCRAFSQQQDLLRVVSVVVEYTCTGHSNCPPDTAVEQIESGCQSGSWSNTVFGSSDSSEIRSNPDGATFSTTAREDCSFCVSTQLALGQGIETDTVTHCVGE